MNVSRSAKIHKSAQQSPQNIQRTSVGLSRRRKPFNYWTNAIGITCGALFKQRRRLNAVLSDRGLGPERWRALEPSADVRLILAVLVTELAVQVLLFSSYHPHVDQPDQPGRKQQRPDQPKPTSETSVQKQKSQVHRISRDAIRPACDDCCRGPKRDDAGPRSPKASDAPH